MLRIWMGRANTGKTARVLQAIQEGGEDPGALLLCPEHASHRAEMELCPAQGPPPRPGAPRSSACGCWRAGCWRGPRA